METPSSSASAMLQEKPAFLLASRANDVTFRRQAQSGLGRVHAAFPPPMTTRASQRRDFFSRALFKTPEQVELRESSPDPSLEVFRAPQPPEPRRSGVEVWRSRSLPGWSAPELHAGGCHKVKLALQDFQRQTNSGCPAHEAPGSDSRSKRVTLSPAARR